MNIIFSAPLLQRANRIGKALLLLLTLAHVGAQAQAMESAKSMLNAGKTDQTAASADTINVVMETSLGSIEIALDQAKAPQTVENFLRYADQGFYNETIFHRVIDDFMIQGGGFTADMQRKTPQAPVLNEADNGLLNLTGTIAMARTSAPHSATSQFFINVVDNTSLNHRGKAPAMWGYAVFGKVVAGMDVVNSIKSVGTATHMGHGNVPLEPIVIKRVYRKP